MSRDEHGEKGDDGSPPSPIILDRYGRKAKPEVEGVSANSNTSKAPPPWKRLVRFHRWWDGLSRGERIAVWTLIVTALALGVAGVGLLISKWTLDETRGSAKQTERTIESQRAAMSILGVQGGDLKLRSIFQVGFTFKNTGNQTAGAFVTHVAVRVTDIANASRTLLMRTFREEESTPVDVGAGIETTHIVAIELDDALYELLISHSGRLRYEQTFSYVAYTDLAGTPQRESHSLCHYAVFDRTTGRSGFFPCAAEPTPTVQESVKASDPSISFMGIDWTGDPSNIKEIKVDLFFLNSGADADDFAGDGKPDVRVVDKRTSESVDIPITRDGTPQGYKLGHGSQFVIRVPLGGFPAPWEAKWQSDRAYVEISGTVSYAATRLRRVPTPYCIRLMHAVGKTWSDVCNRRPTTTPEDQRGEPVLPAPRRE